MSQTPYLLLNMSQVTYFRRRFEFFDVTALDWASVEDINIEKIFDHNTQLYKSLCEDYKKSFST